MAVLHKASRCHASSSLLLPTGLKVDGMDALAVKQACKFAKQHALKNGPIMEEQESAFQEQLAEFMPQVKQA